MRHIVKFLCIISVFCIHNILWADSQSRYFMGQVGIGGAYYNFGGEDVSSAGGYLAGEARFFVFQRVQSVFGVRIGGGQSKAYQMPDVAEKSGFMISDQYFKIGANIASLNTPLYINLLAESNSHDSRHGLSRKLKLLGADIEGAMPLGNISCFEYSLGYTYTTNQSSYVIGDKTSYIQRDPFKSYILSASIGLSRKLSLQTIFYTKLIGKYQNLKASFYSDGAQGYPSSANIVAMLEFGFRGL